MSVPGPDPAESDDAAEWPSGMPHRDVLNKDMGPHSSVSSSSDFGVGGTGTDYCGAESPTPCAGDPAGDTTPLISAPLSDGNSGIPVNLVYFVAPNADSPLSIKKAFLANHPVQPKPSSDEKFPFNTSKVYFRKVANSDEVIPRSWVSYCKQNNSLYCAPCMAFAAAQHQHQSNFITGLSISNKTDIYQSIVRHEKSKSHMDAVNAALAAQVEKDVASLVNTDLAKLQKSQKDLKRQVVERIIDLSIFIGRQGLAYRGGSRRSMLSMIAASTMEIF